MPNYKPYSMRIGNLPFQLLDGATVAPMNAEQGSPGGILGQYGMQQSNSIFGPGTLEATNTVGENPMQAGAEPNDGLASLRTASSAIMGASGTNGLAGGSGGDNLAVIDATGRQPWHSGSLEPGVLFPNEEARTYYVPPSMRNAIVISRLQREPFGPETRSAIRNGREGGADIQTVTLTPEHQLRADQVGTIPADQLGNLSMAYETGFRPGQEGMAAGEVSSGRGDRGGLSYGAYQLSSTQGQVQNFLRQEGRPWASRFADLQPTQPGAFGEAWKDTAAGDPGNFFDAQHAYIERTHYEPVVAKVLSSIGVDIDSLPDAVRNAVWSISVQHARAPALVTQAVQNLQGRSDPSDRGYSEALINQLYDVRSNYVRNIRGLPHVGALLRRYGSERRDALTMLNQQPGGNAE